jgi:CheY-like chemotaxis protein
VSEGGPSEAKGTAVEFFTDPGLARDTTGQEALHRSEDESETHPGGEVVLVVDDDLDTQAVVREYLEQLGLTVKVAGNGLEAEEALRTVAPDAIILDLHMPVMDGWTFLARVRERPRHQDVPVVIITAKDLSLDERTRLERQTSGVVPMRVGFETGLQEVLSEILSSVGPRMQQDWEDSRS